MDAQTQRELLQLARRSVLAASRGEPAPSVEGVAGATEEFSGVFVTLHKRGRLRGCIGTFDPSGTLPEAVAEYAQISALHDQRFPPVSENEVADLNIEISVLSPIERTMTPEALEVGKHGIYLKTGAKGRETTACFLPQVAPEQGWNAEEFLSALCSQKCWPPLAPDAWRDTERVQVYLFTADVFGEDER